MIGRHQYIKNLLETINFIQDEKYQERVWAKGQGPECNSYTETINTFFEEYNPIEDELTAEKYGLTELQISLLNNFATKLYKFVNSVPAIPNNKELIKDPRWEEIRNFAKMIYYELS